jgi:hypothetical protein
MFSASMSSRIALDTCYRAARLPRNSVFRCPNLTDTVEIDGQTLPQKINFSLKLCKLFFKNRFVQKVNEPRPFWNVPEFIVQLKNVEQWSHFSSTGEAAGRRLPPTPRPAK